MLLPMFDRDGELMPVKLLTRDERVGAVLNKYGLSDGDADAAAPVLGSAAAALSFRWRVWLPWGDVCPVAGLLHAVCGRG